MGVMIQFFDKKFLETDRSVLFEMEFNTSFVSARDLISSRVEQEYAARKENRGFGKISLVEVSEYEKELNTSLVSQNETENKNIKSFVNFALKAFESNGFFMLINDKQVESLDEVIEVLPGLQVEFFELPAIVGG